LKIDASFLGRNVLRRNFGPEWEDVKGDKNYVLRRFAVLSMPLTKYCWDD